MTIADRSIISYNADFSAKQKGATIEFGNLTSALLTVTAANNPVLLEGVVIRSSATGTSGHLFQNKGPQSDDDQL